MERTKILLLSFAETNDLAVSFKNVLRSAKSFEFDLLEIALQDGALDRHARTLSRAALQRSPNLTVLCLPQMNCERAAVVFGFVRRQLEAVPILVATQMTEPEQCREMLALGPDDFVTPPFRPVDILPRLWRLRLRSSKEDPVVLQLKEKLGLKQLIGESKAFLAEINKIEFMARCNTGVLITGETGTGKEMFARAIHHLSSRSAKPFNPVNCGAIPIDLVENELFGHEPGAFTGASVSSAGLIRESDGGSLFLDEVDCLPLLAQVKLLRFLQEKEIRPLGARTSCRVDVRVIAAANANLEDAVAKGRFRQDLYYRLNIVGLVLPPLRERKDDVPILARHFLVKHAAASGAPGRDLTMAAIQKLMFHDWPGNVRELENVIERSLILSSRTVLHPEDIQLPATITLKERETFQTTKAKMIAQFERSYIQDLLRTHDGNISKAAHAAGKHRRAFWEIMRKHRINVPPTSGLLAMHSARRPL